MNARQCVDVADTVMFYVMVVGMIHVPTACSSKPYDSVLDAAGRPAILRKISASIGHDRSHV